MQIIALVNEKFQGDKNNVLGSAIATEQVLSNGGQKANHIIYALAADSQEKDITNLKEQIKTYAEPVIIITAGEHMIEPLLNLKKDPQIGPHIYTSWSSHQIPKALDSMVGVIDNIVLPEHELDQTTKQLFQKSTSQLTPTIGVPHNTQKALIQQEYDKARAKIIPANKYYLVVLGGDAPDKDKQIHCYTDEEAYAMGITLGKKALQEGAVVLGGNGPRTGKHDPETLKEVPGRHRVGANGEYNIDPVSDRFIKGLKAAGLQENKQYQFFDFIFGQPSMYKAMLGAVLNTPGSKAFMPGESTSMPSEACDILAKGSVVLCENKAMNPSHHKYASLLLAGGYCSGYLALDQTLKPSAVDIEGKPKLAAQTVAESIAKHIIEQQEQQSQSGSKIQTAYQKAIESFKEASPWQKLILMFIIPLLALSELITKSHDKSEVNTEAVTSYSVKSCAVSNGNTSARAVYQEKETKRMSSDWAQQLHRPEDQSEKKPEISR